MGSLIAKIHDIEINKYCADPTTAITFYSSPNLEFDKKNHKLTGNKVVQVNIGLTTDIWFPWIDGDIHAYRPHGEEPYLQPVDRPDFGTTSIEYAKPGADILKRSVFTSPMAMVSFRLKYQFYRRCGW